jgi:porphobilinogen synthase
MGDLTNVEAWMRKCVEAYKAEFVLRLYAFTRKRIYVYEEVNMYFPVSRLRRTRQNDKLRKMVRETYLQAEKFIFPLFVVEGSKIKKEIAAMPGQYHFSLDMLIKEVEDVKKAGVPAVLLFGIPDKKDDIGSGAYDNKGIVQEAIRLIKKKVPEMMVITDVCLCEYTSHGHCGVIKSHQSPVTSHQLGDKKGKTKKILSTIDYRLSTGFEVDNDASLELIAKTALSHAEAGADMVAPSDMMDGRIGAIRSTLDESGLNNIPVMSYSVKYASAFYGPFREAAHSTPQFGDRRSYQMDPPNSHEALREVMQDLDEGADIIMVKPALSYLDIIKKVKSDFDIPVAAYNVSGEYAMVKAAAMKGWIDEKKITLEILTSIRRAGADIIITYHAKDAAKWLKEEK